MRSKIASPEINSHIFRLYDIYYDIMYIYHMGTTIYCQYGDRCDCGPYAKNSLLLDFFRAVVNQPPFSYCSTKYTQHVCSQVSERAQRRLFG